MMDPPGEREPEAALKHLMPCLDGTGTPVLGRGHRGSHRCRSSYSVGFTLGEISEVLARIPEQVWSSGYDAAGTFATAPAWWPS